MKMTFQPKKRQRSKVHGFRSSRKFVAFFHFNEKYGF